MRLYQKHQVSDTSQNTTKSHRTLWLFAIGATAVMFFVLAALYLNSPQFHDYARRRLITQLEDITGGAVDMGSLQWNLSKLEFHVSDVTIHGLEARGEVPYAHVDQLQIKLKVLSLLRRDIGLRSLRMDSPVIHIMVYPDGHTNQPKPKIILNKASTPVQQVFDLAMDHAELNDGQLIVNEHRMPLDFSAENVQVVMNYESRSNSFLGSVKFGKATTKYAKFLPVDANADIQFRLTQDQLELTAFHVLTQKSKMEGTGKFSDFAQPVIDVTYRASLDAQELAPITRNHELRAGTFELSGAAHFASGQLTSNGRVVVTGGSYHVPGIKLANVDAAADYSFDPKELAFRHITARLFGGIARGEITVTNWLATSDPKAAQQTGTARLNIDNMPIGMAANAFSTGRMNFGQLSLAGTTKGTVNARWRVSPLKAVADLDLNVSPPANPKAGDLPLLASLKGAYDAGNDRLRIEALSLVLPDVRANASGVLGTGREQLRLTLDAKEISQLRPLLPFFNMQNTAAAQLTGELKFDGTVSGNLASPSVEGKVEVANFDFPIDSLMSERSVGTPSSIPSRRMHLDSGSAIIAVNENGIIARNGVLHRGTSQANFDISAAMKKRQLMPESRIAAHVALHNASLADLQQIDGYGYPVKGWVSANFNLSGTKANPQGGGHIEILNGSLYGEPIKSASADIALANREARVSNLRLVHNGAQVTGTGTYDLDTTAFHFQAVGSNFQLATIEVLRNRRGTAAGVLNFSATGTGTLAHPIVNASARVHNVVVNGERVGDATLTAVTKGDEVEITARSNFQTAELTMDGRVNLRDPNYPINMSAQFTNFDFMPYLQPLLPGNMKGKSFVAGSFVMQGPLKDRQKLTIKAQIPKLTADLQSVELRNTEPIQLSMQNQVVRVDSFKLVGPDTQLDVRGTVRLGEENRIRLRAEGRMNLKLAESFNSDLNSSGFADLNVSVGGVISKPTVQGEVRITNGAVTLIDFPNGLSNVNGLLVFTEDRVQVQSLTAHTGGGDIQIGGFATYSPVLAFNLTANGQDIRLRYPQGISSTANMDLKLTGSMTNAMLSGDVTITRFGLNSQFDLANYIAKSSRPTEAPVASLLNNLHFNVHVTSTPELQVQSSLAKLAGNVDLRVRGTGTNPTLLGRVNITEGQISFNGTNYRLERGDVTFNNPTKTEPNIDVEATTRVRDYDLSLGFHGQLSHGLNTTYRSDPPLPQADIINLLAFGRTREEAETITQNGGNSYTGVVGNAILGQALTSAVGDRVQKLFGVSRVKIAPDVGSTTTNPTAQVTIEQTVSNKVTITYITSLAQSSQQSIFVEYTINPELSVIAGRDQYGVVSFDVKMRRRKK